MNKHSELPYDIMDAQLSGVYDYVADMMDKYSADDAPKQVTTEDFVELADCLKRTISSVRGVLQELEYQKKQKEQIQ